MGRPYNHGHEWLERATLSPGSYTALIATLPMLDALYTDLCVQGGTVEGDHYYPTTWEPAWPIRPTESGAGSSVLNSWRFRVHLQARKLLKLSSPQICFLMLAASLRCILTDHGLLLYSPSTESCTVPVRQ